MQTRQTETAPLAQGRVRYQTRCGLAIPATAIHSAIHATVHATLHPTIHATLHPTAFHATLAAKAARTHDDQLGVCIHRAARDAGRSCRGRGRCRCHCENASGGHQGQNNLLHQASSGKKRCENSRLTSISISGCSDMPLGFSPAWHERIRVNATLMSLRHTQRARVADVAKIASCRTTAPLSPNSAALIAM